MSQKTATLVRKDLAARKSGWEDKQRVWYEMRHEGLRRQNKPFPSAADLHFPMADGMIDKLKPFFFAQVFGNEHVATFIAEKPQAKELSRAAGAAFDFHLKEETNFFEEILSNIDNMEMSGGAPIKTRWDPDKDRLEFDAIDPLYVIVPKGTTDYQRADRLTHVRQYTVDAYQRLGEQYKTDEETIRRIRGKGIRENDQGNKEDEKSSREGITFGEDDDQIVLWEVYIRQPDNSIRVETFAPASPEVEIRATFTLAKPYLDIPVFFFPMEIKDKGVYASRGIPERIAPHEMYATRLWNEKADSMTFLSKPLFTHDGAAMNLQNIKLTPGQIVPNNLRAVQMGKPPFEFDQELNSTRMIAEYQIGMPDFGTGQALNTKERKTATEVSAITNLMSQSTDLRAWIFRRSLAKLYRQAWALLSHFAKDKLATYYADNDVQQLDPQALEQAYRVFPSGTADGWNKAARMARAQQRLQMYRGDPSINQPALTRHALEEDDPRLVKELWVDPQTTQADQIEDQADEISVLLIGFPARVKPVDDHSVHLQTLMGYVQDQQQLGRPIDPIAAKKIVGHAQAHLEQLMQAKGRKQEAKQLAAQMQPVFAPLAQAAQAFEQQMQQRAMAQQQQTQQAGQMAQGGPPPAQLPSQQQMGGIAA